MCRSLIGSLLSHFFESSIILIRLSNCNVKDNNSSADCPRHEHLLIARAPRTQMLTQSCLERPTNVCTTGSVAGGAQTKAPTLSASCSSSSQPFEDIQLGVNSLPPLPRDSTDRNRTSPFSSCHFFKSFYGVAMTKDRNAHNFMPSNVHERTPQVRLHRQQVRVSCCRIITVARHLHHHTQHHHCRGMHDDGGGNRDAYASGRGVRILS